MNIRDYFYPTKSATALAPATISSAAVQNGAAISLEGVSAIKFVLDVYSRVNGTIKIQDVQFANDSSFTENVSTFSADEDLLKNDVMSSVSAIDQTILSAVGKRAIRLDNKAIKGQKFVRVRTETTGTVNLGAQVWAELRLDESPVVQS